MTLKDLIESADCNALIIRNYQASSSKWEVRYCDFKEIPPELLVKKVVSIKPCYSTELLVKLN